MPNETHICWDYEGKPDPLVGTGATRAERSLVWVAGLATLAFYALIYKTGRLDWSWWQYLIAGVIALDVGGGVVANSLNSCKRFYHAPLQPNETGSVAAAKNHWFFVALHLHPILVWGLYGGGLRYGLAWYVLLLLGSAAVLETPLYLHRPVAMLGILLALLVNAYLIPPLVGFEWLMPALFVKIVYGHLVREEPYRPLPA